MMNHVTRAETVDPPWKIASRLGFWSALLTAVFAAAAFAKGITTPPRSGPFCANSCVTYPYTNVASFVPNDYLWMYPGLVLAPTFVTLIACIHQYSKEDNRIFSQIGLSFAVISATAILIDYFIQLAVMQPSLLKGETDGLVLFSQYNPHGIFIALEDLGYLMMSVALLFAGMGLAGHTRLEQTVQWLFITSSLAAIGALVGLSLLYGQDLEYRFEVVVLTINWTVLIITGILLSILFKRATTTG